jgi:hypothetical protein
VRRVLVPLGARSGHDELRTRLLASIHRLGARDATLLRVMPSTATPRDRERAAAELRRVATDEEAGGSRLSVVAGEDVAGAVARYAVEADLAVLGLRRVGHRRKVFGNLGFRVARETNCGLILISRRGQPRPLGPRSASGSPRPESCVAPGLRLAGAALSGGRKMRPFGRLPVDFWEA